MSIDLEKVTDLINKFDEDLQEIVKEYGAESFASGIDVRIQNIPLGTFHALTDGRDISVKFYDVSEGTQCLETRVSVGTWGHVFLSSNPIKEISDED